MATPRAPTDRSRAAVMVLVAALHGLLLAGLVAGLAPGALRPTRDTAMMAITPSTPPPPPPPIRRVPPRRSHPAIAPPPGTAPPMALPTAHIALAAPQTAAVNAGDTGTGTGSGAANGTGKGTGSGGTRPVQLAGDIRVADYPAASRALRIGHAVLIVFTVGTDGRAHDCQVREASPDPDADAITCRLAEQRFRFRPATDAAGNPVTAIYGWRQKWFN